MKVELVSLEEILLQDFNHHYLEGMLKRIGETIDQATKRSVIIEIHGHTEIA